MGSETLETTRGAPVWQFAVFADNKVGRLNEIVQRLAAQDVHILALSTIDTTENTILRLVPDYPEAARTCLRAGGYSFTESLVLAVEIAREGQIREITEALVEAEINIHYLYPFVVRPEAKGALAMSLEDYELASQVLSDRGLRVLNQADLAR